MERLQKRIAHSGYCSRRKAEELIVAGRVSVNGVKVTTLGTQVADGDEIAIDGVTLEKEEPVYYVLYKPEGCVSTTDDEKNRKTVLDFIETEKRIYPVGRLDYDTSGVLLLTNDGAFANAMVGPEHDVEKEYRVKMQGFLRKEESKQLSRGIVLDGRKTRSARIHSVVYHKESGTSSASIVLKEGKYHQVKRMFEYVGHPVLKLQRTRFGEVTLDGMRPGEVRLLKPHERKRLLTKENRKKV
jgi:23S rRNA pseudouridine2605 synthase